MKKTTRNLTDVSSKDGGTKVTDLGKEMKELSRTHLRLAATLCSSKPEAYSTESND